MIKIKDILFEQIEKAKGNYILQDMGDTEDALNYIRPLFNDDQWNNFQSMWDNIDKDTWYRQGPLQRIGIGKKINKPLSINFYSSDEVPARLATRAHYGSGTNTIMIPDPTYAGPPSDEELMKTYPNAPSIEDAKQYHKESWDANTGSPEAVAQMIFAELGHAQQEADAKKNIISQYFRRKKDNRTDWKPRARYGDASDYHIDKVTTGDKRSIFTDRRSDRTYDVYNTKGTMEHDAHGIIEPILYQYVFGDDKPEWAHPTVNPTDITIKDRIKRNRLARKSQKEGVIKLRDIYEV